MVELHQSRQATALASWGLGRDGDGWWRQAACAQTADLHTADLRQGWQQPGSVQGMARHVCRAHCPVIEQCRRDALRQPPNHLVQGGSVWVTSSTRPGRESSVQPPDPGCGPWCAHLRGEVVAA